MAKSKNYNDFAVICGERQVRKGDGALLEAAVTLNQLGVIDPVSRVLMGDQLFDALAVSGLLYGRIVAVRHELLRRPGTVANHPELVALWDEGPELRIRGGHQGDGDTTVIGAVPWAGCHLHLGFYPSTDRAHRTAWLHVALILTSYQRVGAGRSQGTPFFEADLYSEHAGWGPYPYEK